MGYQHLDFDSWTHLTWYSEDHVLQWLQALRANLYPNAARAHVPCHLSEDRSVLPLVRASIYWTEPPQATPIKMDQSNYDTTQMEISSSLGITPTPEYICQTGHIISPAPLLKLANLSHDIGLTSTTPLSKSIQPVKTKAVRKQPLSSNKPPHKKKGNRVIKRKGVVKKKKGGGLKVKIKFPSVSKVIKEMSSASKESTTTDDFSSETGQHHFHDITH